MSDLFNSDQEITIDPTKDYLPELVGEGKKFKEVTDLARAKVEADAFIERLKRENAELRNKKDTELSMQTFLDNLDKKLKAPPAIVPDGTPPKEPTADQPKGISQEEILSLFEQQAEKREAEKRKQENLAQAVAASQKAFGANYQLVLEQKARELGIGKDFLSEVAQKNVPAFLRLVGADVAQDNPQLFPTGSVQTSRPSNSSQGKKFSDFEKIRKEDPQRYMSAAVQNEIMAEAIKQGDAFYS